MPKRLMPTRDNLRRSHGALNASENDIAGVELMLYLIRASDVIREEIYGALRRDTGLTEGKFALLMILYDISEPVPLVELSVRIGVSPSTTSIMVTRMLQTEEPLVAKTVDPVDARSALISLTPAGRLLESAMLPHFNRVSDFAKTLSSAERETMIALLKKLVAGH